MVFSSNGMEEAMLRSNPRLAAMFHTYPSRTRPLSPLAPMVLGPQGPGRVGRRQAIKDTLDENQVCLLWMMKYKLSKK